MERYKEKVCIACGAEYEEEFEHDIPWGYCKDCNKIIDSIVPEKVTRTKVPKGVSRVVNAATGETKGVK